MWRWLSENWGNAASLISLVVAIWSWAYSFRIGRIVESRLAAYKLVIVVELLAERRALVRSLVESQAKVLRGSDADRRREILNEILALVELSVDGTIRTAIGEIRRQPDSDEVTRSRLRFPGETLTSISSRLRDQTARRG